MSGNQRFLFLVGVFCAILATAEPAKQPFFVAPTTYQTISISNQISVSNHEVVPTEEHTDIVMAASLEFYEHTDIV